MRSSAAVAIMLAAIGLAAFPAEAHHSFAAEYSVRENITIEGDVVNFDYRNPHTFITVNVPDAQGKKVRWTAEWGAPRLLEPHGVKKDTIHRGDHAIISGAPGRNPAEHKVQLRTIKRPADGFQVPAHDFSAQTDNR